MPRDSKGRRQASRTKRRRRRSRRVRIRRRRKAGRLHRSVAGPVRSVVRRGARFRSRRRARALKIARLLNLRDASTSLMTRAPSDTTAKAGRPVPLWLGRGRVRSAGRSTRGPARNVRAGDSRPKPRPPKHRAILDRVPVRAWRASGTASDAESAAPTDPRTVDWTATTHSRPKAGEPRGLLCCRCNRFLPYLCRCSMAAELRPTYLDTDVSPRYSAVDES